MRRSKSFDAFAASLLTKPQFVTSLGEDGKSTHAAGIFWLILQQIGQPDLKNPIQEGELARLDRGLSTANWLDRYPAALLSHHRIAQPKVIGSGHCCTPWPIAPGPVGPESIGRYLRGSFDQ
ncbi:hypothetical protein Sjap_025730 [Stephania japonica]|uniref:Uncharacterized protein n=1 Tax=Stephania japonica TaxID=461633 RepID=A0AAP0HFW6_9MAGN